MTLNLSENLTDPRLFSKHLRSAFRSIYTHLYPNLIRSQNIPVDLSPWQTALQDVVKPFVLAWFLDGYDTSISIRKALQPQPNTYLLAAVDNLSLELAQSTLDTLTGDIEEVRQIIREEIERPSQAIIARRLKPLFTDQFRADRIAVTETRRALHAGQLQKVKESAKATKKYWIASADACDDCLRMLQVGQIPLDEAFWVNPKGGPYAFVYHPPFHPWCYCSLGYSI